MKGNFQVGADVLEGWRDDVMSGKPPTLYPLGTGGLARLEVGPKLVTLIGGAPGAGKTAFTMQGVIDALRITPTLRVLVCNVEMPPAVLMDRQLARLSGVDLTTIRYRRLEAEHADRISQGINTLAAIAGRLCFVRPPFNLHNVAETADDFGAGLMLLDYIQRIAPPGEHENRRGSVDAAMNYLRQFADAGTAVIVISAVGRSKDKHGRNTYSGDGLNLASFRESSELEFGADDAFILAPDAADPSGEAVTLKHLKARHGEALDMSLAFDKAHQRFTPHTGTDPATPTEPGKLQAALAAAWNRTPAALPGEGGDDD